MNRVKRILAILVMVISVLVLVLSLAGIIAVWIVRPQIASSLENVAANAETRVANLNQGLDQLDTGLADAHDQVAEMEQNLQSFGEDTEENKPLITALTDSLESKFGQFIDTASQIATTIIEAAAALNSTVETLNALPFIDIPNPEFERLETLAQDFEDLQTQVQDLRTTIDQRQSEIIQGTVSIIATPLTRINDRLDSLQSRVAGYIEILAAIQEGLSYFESSIRSWLTYAAVLITLILLWLAFSQTGLFVLGWRFYSGKDLLVDFLSDAPPNQDSTEQDEDRVIENE